MASVLPVVVEIVTLDYEEPCLPCASVAYVSVETLNPKLLNVGVRLKLSAGFRSRSSSEGAKLALGQKLAYSV